MISSKALPVRAMRVIFTMPTNLLLWAIYNLARAFPYPSGLNTFQERIARRDVVERARRAAQTPGQGKHAPFLSDSVKIDLIYGTGRVRQAPFVIYIYNIILVTIFYFKLIFDLS